MERLNFDRFKVAAAATLVMFAGAACAETELFGQINRAISHTDDKRESKTLFVDNAFSPSSLGVKTMSHLNKCVTVGGTAELALAANNSRAVNNKRNINTLSNVVLVKHLDAWVSGGMWGKLSLGYGDAASSGIARMSYSKAGETVSSFRVADMAGAIQLHASGSPLVANGPYVAQAFVNLDGVNSVDQTAGFLSNKNRVRWDSEKWNGLSLAVSHGGIAEDFETFGQVVDGADNSRTYTDAALRYEGSFDDVALSAGIGAATFTKFHNVANERNQRLVAGSVAAEHKSTGINLAVGFADKRQNTSAKNNVKNLFVQLGKHFDLTHYGKTHLVLDTTTIKNSVNGGNVDNWVNGSKANSYAFGAVQDLDKINASVYASARTYKLKNADVRYDKLMVASAGVLVKFGAML